MFGEVHTWNRKFLPNYLEIFLKVPMAELRKRDSKGIYSRFDHGLLRNVAGLDLQVDEPKDADMVFEFSNQQGPNELADLIINRLNGEEV